MDEKKVAAKAIIVNDDGNILIIKRSDRDKHYPGIWDIPGGQIKHGEPVVDGLRREMKEELGLDIQMRNQFGMHAFEKEDGHDDLMFVYLCTTDNTDPKLNENYSDFEWVTTDSDFSKLHYDYSKELKAYENFFKEKLWYQ